MSENRLFAQLLAQCEGRAVTTNSFWPVTPYQPCSLAVMVVAPRLSDLALQELDRRLLQLTSQSIAVVHAAAKGEHQALILSVQQLPELAHLRAWSEQLAIDIGRRSHTKPWTWPTLALFDMDSTLITMEVIDELAKEAGVGEQVAAITEAAMRGELDFNASLIARVATLKGLSLNVIERVRDRLQFNPGVPEFAQQALLHDCYLALVSGGFIPFAEWVSKTLQFNFARANELGMAEQQLSGEVNGEIVNAQVKARTVGELQQQQQANVCDVMAVGDGANDLLMLQASGFGVAFRAKPKLRMAADLALDSSDMRGLIALFK